MKRKSMITMLVIALMLVLSLTVLLSACGKNKDDTPATYSVTVTNGTGGGEYAAGATVTITANAPETGKEFTSWTINGVSVDDKTKAEITFTMPANAVTATANYGDVQYEFALENCTADSWNIKGVDDLTGLDLTKSPLTFTMPANDINVAAVLEDINYTVSVNGGTANKTTAHYGDSITITAAAPETGKEFTSWTLSGVTVDDKTKAEITFTMPANAVTATANYGDKAYLFALENCTADKESAKFGEQVTFTADVFEDKRFVGWSVKGVDETGLDLTKSPLTITMPANDINVAAQLEQLYKITVSGGCTADKEWAAEGEQVTVTKPTPPEGHAFYWWSTGITQDWSNRENTVTFTMPAGDVQISASKVLLNYLFTMVGGTATGVKSGEPNTVTDGRSNGFDYGTDVTITANEPETGKRFTGWTITGVDTSELVLTDRELTFTMPANAVTATANYDFINYTVSVTGGIAKVNGVETETAHYGDTVTITANEPGTNKEFIGWNSPDDVVFNNNTSIETTFTMPASNVTVNAVFGDINKYSVLVNYGTSGTSETQTAYCGDPVTITAKNIEGKIFVRWEITGLDTEELDLTKSPLAFTMPENNVTANAIYEDLITLTFEGSTAQSESLTYRKGASKTFRIELGDSQELCEYDISLTNKSCTFKVYDSIGNEIEPIDNGDGSMRIAVTRQDTYTIRVTYEGTSSSSQCTIKITASSPTV